MKEAIIPVITGPTGSGKSNLVYALAEEGIKFEIISADAFQVYKGLDIGTAKPEKEILESIPHHLIDFIPTDGSYTAGDFAEQAESAITKILASGSIPVIVGGTGLYIRSLTDGIFETPPPDEEYRQALRERAVIEGTELLHKELGAIDKEAAARIHENDLVRIIRGLEVWKNTGVPISKAHKKFSKPPKYKYNVMVIDVDRDKLYQDIDIRVIKMLKSGWLEEVKTLLNAGYSTDLPSFRAIGYRELAEVVMNKKDINSTVELIAQKTRNYAKRQLTWFRGTENVTFMESSLMKKMVRNILHGA